MRTLHRFFEGKRGQELIDYTLRTVFIAAASAAMLMATAGASIQGILSEVSKH
jgi:hypothetical protein